MSTPPSRQAGESPTDSNSTTSHIATPSQSPTQRGRQRGQQRPPNWVQIPQAQSPVSIFTGRSASSPSSVVGSDNKMSTMSPGSIDRVFPIRSAVSIDPLANPRPQTDPSVGYPGMLPPAVSRVPVPGRPTPGVGNIRVPHTRKTSTSDASVIGSTSDTARRRSASVSKPIVNVDHQFLTRIVAPDDASQTSEVSRQTLSKFPPETSA